VSAPPYDDLVSELEWFVNTAEVTLPMMEDHIDAEDGEAEEVRERIADARRMIAAHRQRPVVPPAPLVGVVPVVETAHALLRLPEIVLGSWRPLPILRFDEPRAALVKTRAWDPSSGNTFELEFYEVVGTLPAPVLPPPKCQICGTLFTPDGDGAMCDSFTQACTCALFPPDLLTALERVTRDEIADIRAENPLFSDKIPPVVLSQEAIEEVFDLPPAAPEGIVHAFECDMDDDCSCAVGASRVCPLNGCTNVALKSILIAPNTGVQGAMCEGCGWNGTYADLREVCGYCHGTGVAYDPQTGEGPECPACKVPVEERLADAMREADVHFEDTRTEEGKRYDAEIGSVPLDVAEAREKVVQRIYKGTDEERRASAERLIADATDEQVRAAAKALSIGEATLSKADAKRKRKAEARQKAAKR
jgi:hypothetical protein